MAKKASKKKVIRVAFIGAGGRSASVHYPSIRDLPGAEIAAMCDLNEELLNKRGDEFGVKKRYTNYKEMIEKEKPDAVYASMPPQLLFDVAATVMDMKTNLIVEKPPAVTAEQTRQMALIAKRNKVLTAVTFQRRYCPIIRGGKKMCEKTGAVHTAVSTFYKNAVGAKPYYNGAMDILTCDAIHAVDTLRYLCGGEVESVASDVRRLYAEHWTAHLALVKFSSGATGVLLTNWMTGRRFFTVEIHTKGMSLFGDPEEGGKVYADGKNEPVADLNPFEMAGSQDAHRAFGPYDMSAHFMDCIRKGKQPETNFEDATKTMELIDAIYHSQI
ncbi:MAG: Gfo/Idh/MocA family oxidoreductase [Planctomycetes bacterium]|nr:Gfo/Idh/MocA family oxidoreductase [Planctomycetota bacterium]